MICWPNRRSWMPARPSSGIDLHHAENIALRFVGIHAQQQIGRGQIEKTQRVRLDHLRQVQQSAAAWLPWAGSPWPWIASQALADAIRWLTGQMPQMRAIRTAFRRTAAPRRTSQTREPGSRENMLLPLRPAPLVFSVILPWPSRRVTGSIKMVRDIVIPLSRSKPGQAGYIRHSVCQQLRQHRVERVRRRRTTGQKQINAHKLMYRPHFVQQLGNDHKRRLLLQVGIFKIGSTQHRIRTKRIAHGRDIPGDSAVSHRDQQTSTLANQQNFFNRRQYC